MKRFIGIILMLALVFVFAACQNNSREEEAVSEAVQTTVSATEATSIVTTSETTSQAETTQSTTAKATETEADIIDLTLLNNTMLYSELFDIASQPDDYIGKTVKMRGTYAVYEGEGRSYYVCEVMDTTACCSQGLEFVLKKSEEYPEYHSDSPVEIEVSGTLNTYLENGQTYVQLEEASVVTL